MAIRIAAYANGDDALVAWQLDKQIPGCLGFALYRKRNGKDEIVENRIGWEDLVPPPAPGTHKPSTVLQSRSCRRMRRTAARSTPCCSTIRS